jgi:hypothetical protein
MPNATVRADARTTPKPPPGSAESIRLQTAELETATALVRAAKVVDRELAEPNEPDAHDAAQAFSRAYGRWLKARAAVKGGDDFPEDEKAVTALFHADRTALRELFSLPAVYTEDVWLKFEVFEAELTDERVTGEPRDSVLMLALGSIKADLCNLGICERRTA